MTTLATSTGHHERASPEAARTTSRLSFRPTVDVEQVRANWTTVEQLLLALEAGDAEAVLSRYDAHARIDHPLLGALTRDEFAVALRTFLRQTPERELSYQINHAGADRVETEWTLTNVFHASGRTVRLQGATTFVLSGLRITRQTDQFDRRDWSRQALGLTGLALSFVPGWRGYLRRELRSVLELDPA